MASAAYPTEQEAYQAIIAMKADYPEGRSWNNSNSYSWKGGIYSFGSGCAGFAFLLSDAAFGSLRARIIDTIDYDALRVGDILRINNNTHSVVILEKRADSVVIAEGNFNSSIHWGRELPKSTVMSATYYITRYPESAPVDDDPTPDPEEPAEDGVLTLPEGLRLIESEAFAQVAAKAVYIPESCERICADAFLDCTDLRDVYVYAATDIEEDAFRGCDDVEFHWLPEAGE